MNLNKISDTNLHIEYVKRFQREVGSQLTSSIHLYRHGCAYLVSNTDSLPIDKEMFIVVYVNSQNKVLKTIVEAEGSLTSSVVYTRNIIKSCIKYGAAAIMLIHNHPSGNPIISKEDKTITYKIKSACKIMDIILQDHIIIAGEQYVSMADMGLLNLK